MKLIYNEQKTVTWTASRFQMICIGLIGQDFVKKLLFLNYILTYTAGNGYSLWPVARYRMCWTENRSGEFFHTVG